MLKQQNVNENTFVLFLEYNKNIKMSRATIETLTAVYGKSASSLMCFFVLITIMFLYIAFIRFHFQSPNPS